MEQKSISTFKDQDETGKETTLIQKIGFPFEKTAILGRKKTRPVNEPIVMVRRETGDTDIYEGFTAGVIEIETSGRNTKKVEIALPRNKLTSFKWGDERIKGWYVDEREAVAYPTDIIHDSKVIKSIIDAIRINYKDRDAQKLGKLGELLKMGLLLIGLLLAGYILTPVITGLFGNGITLAEAIWGPAKAAAPAAPAAVEILGG